MKTNLLLLILSSFLFTTCDKEKRIEELIMECSYNAFEDNGVYFKKVISDYEALLIKDKFLADNSAKSYLKVVQDIANEKEFEKASSLNYYDELQKLDESVTEKLDFCNLYEINLKENQLDKLTVLEKSIDNVIKTTGSVNPAELAKDMLQVLTEKDFELEFYKIKVFILLSIVEPKQESNVDLPSHRLEELDYDLTNSFVIAFNDKGQIYANDRIVDLNELKMLLRDYIEEFKSESILLFNIDNISTSTYETYSDVSDAIYEQIHFLREKLAIEMFNKDLESLTKEQLLEIHHIYPQDIIY